MLRFCPRFPTPTIIAKYVKWEIPTGKGVMEEYYYYFIFYTTSTANKRVPNNLEWGTEYTDNYLYLYVHYSCNLNYIKSALDN